jgi:hypothetical protein
MTDTHLPCQGKPKALMLLHKGFNPPKETAAASPNTTIRGGIAARRSSPHDYRLALFGKMNGLYTNW